MHDEILPGGRQGYDHHDDCYVGPDGPCRTG